MILHRQLPHMVNVKCDTNLHNQESLLEEGNASLSRPHVAGLQQQAMGLCSWVAVALRRWGSSIVNALGSWRISRKVHCSFVGPTIWWVWNLNPKFLLLLTGSLRPFSLLSWFWDPDHQCLSFTFPLKIRWWRSKHSFALCFIYLFFLFLMIKYEKSKVELLRICFPFFSPQKIVRA